MKEKYTSATDINKFVYCNYSYYYEQVYGTKKLRQLKKQYNIENGFDGKNNNFDRGNKFHDEYKIGSSVVTVASAVLYIVIICVIAFYLYNMYFLGGIYGR